MLINDLLAFFVNNHANTVTRVHRRLVTVKGGVKPDHWGGVRVGQYMDVKSLDMRGRRASFPPLPRPFYPEPRSEGYRSALGG
jgi:hypothetical protein